MRNVIKYGGLGLVLVGIIIVMSNLFTSDDIWEDTSDGANTTNNTYSVNVSLLDKDTNSFIVGANLVIKNSEDKIVSGWTTDDSTHLVTGLKNGTYKLVEESVPDDYEKNEEDVVFKINGDDDEVVMYNLSKSSNNEYSLATNEVGVENTSSFKNSNINVISFILIISGIVLILKSRKSINI